MLDHMTFRVTDLAATRKLYEAALAPLGYRVLHEFEFDGQKMFGMGFDTSEGTKTTTWFIQGASEYGEPVTRGCHLAWKAPNRAAVDAFYAAAIANGARDNGKPGLRKDYGDSYYAAFVVDPDGSRIEAYCGKPA